MKWYQLIFTYVIVFVLGFGVGGIVMSFLYSSNMESEIERQCKIHKKRLWNEGYNSAIKKIGYHDSLEDIVVVIGPNQTIGLLPGCSIDVIKDETN